MPQSMKDYYAILGVERGATKEEIKRSFRRKARECHPDVCDTDDGEERFKEVNEAYDVLSDSRKREIYDRFGTADSRVAGRGFEGVPFNDIFGMGMEDVFSMFFGGAPRAGRARVRREGRDMAARIVVTLVEAATGVEREIEIDRDAPCDACEATGGVDAKVVPCPECGGAGRRAVTRQTFLGAMRTVSPCERCAQTGEVVKDACEVCDGSGRVPKRETVMVPVAPGVQDGMSIRLSGRGEAGLRGAAQGDLIVNVRVAAHDRLFREGDDLHVQVHVPLTTAVLGGTLCFQGLMYEEEAVIPAGTQHGDVVCLKGRGIPRVTGRGVGDLFVHVVVDVPRKLDKEQRGLVERLAESLGAGEGPAVVDRVRDWLGHR